MRRGASSSRLPRHVPVAQVRRTLEAVQRFRMNLVFGAVLVLFCGLLGRLGKLQLVDAGTWQAAAASNHERHYAFCGLRGRIVDRYGRVLASSRPAFAVAVDPSLVADPEDFSRRLAVLLDDPTVAARAYRAIVEAPPGARYRLIRDAVEEPRVMADLAQLRRYELTLRAGFKGLIVEERQVRAYPNGSYAAHVLGRAPRDPAGGAQGALGMEACLHPLLEGTPIRVEVGRDAYSRLLVGRAADPLAGAGLDVPLSLDLVVQHVLETELETMWRTWDARLAVGIVLDPRTGEVLALANRPTFDPEDGTIPPGAMNWAVMGLFEPGSMFKPFTAARGLREGVIRADEFIAMPPAKEFGIGRASVVIHDAHDVGGVDGGGTVVHGLAHSSNVMCAEIAWRLGVDRMVQMMRDLGFASPVGIELPCDERVRYGRQDPRTWNVIDPTLYVAWGQSMQMSPLRLACCFAAFARDDARILRPSLLPGGGGPRTDLPPVCATAEDLAVVRAGLAGCVDEGTAARAFEGCPVPVAGKTGTAEQLGTPFQYAAFIGYAPRDRPRLLVLMMAKVDESFVAAGTNQKPYGGNVAGPAARRVIERTLEYLEGRIDVDAARTAASPAPVRPEPEEDTE